MTSNSNKRALERATNWLAFVGLALDLIGTSSGVARALLLQAAMRRTHRLTARLTAQIDAARHQLGELQHRGGDLSTDAHARAFLASSVRVISRVIALIAEDGRFGVQAAERVIEIEAAGEAALDALDTGTRPRRRSWWRWLWRSTGGKYDGPHPLRALLLWNVDLRNVHVEGLGHIPVLSLAGGTLCLLASVILFAAAEQERGVWISCVVIAASMFVCSILPSNPLSKSLSVRVCATNLV
jgi:hypothetical protein